MTLYSDTQAPDDALNVAFYVQERKPHVGEIFVRIMVPGNQYNIYDQPAKDSHKIRFPRQWLQFQMTQNEGAPINSGTTLAEWAEEQPDTLHPNRLKALEFMGFSNVEQVALASDAQIQRIGMDGVALRDAARRFLNTKTKKESESELEKTRAELQELKATVAELTQKRGPGRPPKIATDQ